MISEKYYYYPPTKPQFFFPKKGFREFQIYYSPYSIISKLFWILYKNVFLIRYCFIINEREIPLPLNQIKKILNLKNAEYFINLGSKGIEQKATIIAGNTEQKKFIKFAQIERSKQLVENEAKTLLEIENYLDIKTAKVLDYGKHSFFTFLVTTVIPGNKANFSTMNDNVFNLLFDISIKETKNFQLKHVFSHGDFCPWNMLIDSKTNKVVLIDWEMAGLKPLGYDLFTFIFQTNFLLNPKKKIKTIILENWNYIDIYFRNFLINNWNDYLVEFATIKVSAESKKVNSKLLSKYQELLNYHE